MNEVIFVCLPNIRTKLIERRKMRGKFYPTLNDILYVVSELTDVSIEKIKSSSRKRIYVYARKIYMWLAYHYTIKSYMQIAGYIGRDHSDLIHHKNSLQGMIDTDTLPTGYMRIISIITEMFQDYEVTRE